MEDAKIVADNTVRNANRNYFAISIGEDGFDGARIEKQRITTSVKVMRRLQLNSHLSLDGLKDSVTSDIYNYLENNSDEFEIMNEEFVKQLLTDRDYYFENFFKGTLNNEVYYPINIKRLLSNTVRNFEKLPLSDLNPMYITRTN